MPGQPVYLVISHWYDDVTIEGVFAVESDAEHWADALRRINQGANVACPGPYKPFGVEVEEHIVQ